jgi:hypothetical protein
MYSSRRQFIGHLTAAGTVAALGLSLGGCSVETDILNWVPLGEGAITAIEAVLTANGIAIAPAITAAVNVAEGAFNALKAAITAYKSTTPPPVGALQDIQTALAAVLSSFGSYLTSVSAVAGKVLGLVVDLADVVISTIEGFQADIGTTSTTTAALTVAGASHTVAAKRRSKGQFRHDWNSRLSAAAAAGINCPRAAYL